MLPQTFWRQIEGTVLDGKVRVGTLLRAEREGLFAAEAVDESLFAGAPGLAVRFIRATSEPVLERYLEGSFLRHPNLLRCFSAGTVELAGTIFVYAVLERVDVTLADVESERPLAPEEARELGVQLIAALQYLHERDLVYCNLDPSTVVRAGDEWKLSEYSQVRLAGRGYTLETRRMLALSAGVPPEAWDGMVSPAWDAWSLAWLLAGAVSERKTGPRDAAAVRSSSRRTLAAPFAAIISECLNPNPLERCGLSRIEDLLRGSESQPAPVPSPVPRPETAAAPEPAAVPEPALVSQPEPAPDPVVRPARLRAMTPRQAMWTAAAFAGAFILLATLAYRPHRSPRAAMVAKPVPLPVRPVLEPVPHVNGEADRAMEDTNSPKALLQRWADAIRTRNLDEQIACYAPKVYAFYGDTDLTPDEIRERRSTAMNRYTDVRQLDISNVDLQVKSPTAAAATFDERWDFKGRQPSSGKVKERLGMRKVGGQWRITSESNLLTYFRNGPNPQS